MFITMTSTKLHGKYSNYHYCIVRECKNTSIKSPEKLWIRVPNDINMRNNWLRLAMRDPKSISTAQIYFCEDHFDLENDMENFMEYKIMGLVKRIRLKPDCIPSRFECQTERKRKFTSTDKLQHAPKKKSVSTSSFQQELLNKEDVIPSCSSSSDKHTHDKAVQVVQHNTEFCDQAVQVQLLHEHVSCQVTQDRAHKVFQGRAIISRVYHYLDKEYEQLKSLTNNCYDLSLLANTLKRTATATGVSEQLITEILEEELSEDDTYETQAEKRVKVDCEDQPEAGISKVNDVEELNYAGEDDHLKAEDGCDPLGSPSHEGSSDTTHDEVKMEIEEHPLELAEDLIESPSEPPVTPHVVVKTEPAGDDIHPHQVQFGTQMPRSKQQSREERLERRRLCERRRKERIKSNEVTREEFLRKDRERYARKKAAGLIVSRHQMTLSKLRILRRKNKISAAAYYYRKKNRATVASIVALADLDETIGDLVEDEPDQSLPNHSDEDNNNSG